MSKDDETQAPTPEHWRRDNGIAGWIPAEAPTPHSEIRETRRALRTLLQNLPGMAYRCKNDPCWTMEFVGGKCAELLGYEPEDIVGNRSISMGEVIHPEDRDGVWDAVQRGVERREAFQIEYRVITRSGEVKWVWEQGCGVYDAAGNLEALEGFITDVSQQKSLEQQVRHAQKMEVVGQLAGGIAHDFNNLLAVIMGLSSYLIDAEAVEGEVRDDILEILRAAEKGQALVGKLLTFSRRQATTPMRVDVAEQIRSLEPMLRGLLGEDIELVLTLDTEVSEVEIDSSQLEQVLLNIAANARDAVGAQGTFRIAVTELHLDAGYESQHLDLAEGPHVMVTLSDDGCGMDEETRRRVFEPFFTTKQAGKGTGLGLAMAYGIVKRAGGHIEVSSAVGRGTTFTLYFPRVDDSQ